MPVTTTSSPRTWSWVAMSAFLDLAGCGVDADSLAGPRLDRILDRRRGGRADAGHLRDLLDRGGAELLERAEVLQEGLAPHLAQARHVVEQALDHRLGPPGPVVGDREPV